MTPGWTKAQTWMTRWRKTPVLSSQLVQQSFPRADSIVDPAVPPRATSTVAIVRSWPRATTRCVISETAAISPGALAAVATWATCAAAAWTLRFLIDPPGTHVSEISADLGNQTHRSRGKK